jgi:hypothetical protein
MFLDMNFTQSVGDEADETVHVGGWHHGVEGLAQSLEVLSPLDRA